MSHAAHYGGAGTAFDWPEADGFGRQPFASLSCGPWSPVAGPAGLAIGAFAWLDPDTGQATNTFAPNTLLGFVLPLANPYNRWQRAFVQPGVPFAQMLIRPGVACVLAASGCFRAKFPQGGQAGQQVYADPNTGLPYMAGPGLIATPWVLMRSGQPNSRIPMSTFAQSFNS
jgi:hypothetical protein